MKRPLEQLRRRFDANPADAVAFGELEVLYSREGRWDYLAEIFEYRATYGTQGEESAGLFSRAGEIWIRQCGDAERAMVTWLRALDAAPTFQPPLDQLVALYRENGDWNGLIQILDKHIESLEAHDPGSRTAALRSSCYQQVGEVWSHVFQRQDKAIAAFRRAFELDPKNVLALYYAREIYQSLGNYETVARLLDLEARAEPDPGRRVALYRELSHVRAEQLGDLEGAVVALKRALSVGGSDPDVMGELALLLLRRAPLGGGEEDRRRAAGLLHQLATSMGGEEALGYCEAALDAWPEHFESLDLFEAICRETGQLGLLADRYRRLMEPLAQSPLLAELYRRAGTLAAERGNLEEAIGFFESLAPLSDPGDYQVLRSLYQQAEGAFGAGGGAALPPRSPVGPSTPPGYSPADPGYDPLVRLRQEAETWRAQGRTEELESVMREILELEPGDPRATSFLEQRYREREDWPAVFQLLLVSARGRELTLAARLLRLREAAGVAEERLRDLDRAVVALREAVTLAPDEPKLRQELERLYLAAGRWDDVVEAYETAAVRAESPAEKIKILKKVAEVHRVRRSDPSAEAKALQRVLELQPSDVTVLEALDETYQREGRWEQLVEVLEKRISTLPEDASRLPLLLRLESLFEQELGLPEEAFRVAQRILQIEPGNHEILSSMKAIDQASGNWERLLETLLYQAAFLEGQPRQECLRQAAHLAENGLGDFERAAELWRQVVALNPDDGQAWVSLADALQKAGRAAPALTALREAVERLTEPEQRRMVLRRIAGLLIEDNDFAQAFHVWAMLADEFQDPEAFEYLVRHYEAAGDHEPLVATLERLVRAVPEPAIRAEALFRKACVLFGPLGRPERAAEELQRLLSEIDPQHRDAHRVLRRLYAEQGRYELAAEIAERESAVVDDVMAKTELLLLSASWYRNQLNDFHRAIAANERVLELDPYRTDVIASLEELYVAVQDWEKLLRLTRARYKASADVELRKRLLIAGADICEKKIKDRERTWGWLRDLFDEFPRHPDVIEHLEGVAKRLNLESDLVGVYGELARQAELDLEQAGWWKKIGHLYASSLHDPARALEAMLRGFALDPDDDKLLGVIDDLALRAQDCERLVSVYDALIEREADESARLGLRRRLGEVLARDQGNASLGFEQLLTVWAHAPEDDQLLQQLEGAAEKAGRWADLLPLYQTLRQDALTNGEKVEYLFRSAEVIEEHLRDPDQALAMIWQALALEPDDEHVATRAMQLIDRLEQRAPERGAGFFWSQLIARFRELAEQRQEESEEQARFLEWMARIYDEYLEDAEAAFQARKQITFLQPNNDGSWAALERLAQRFDLWADLVEHYQDVLDAALDRETALALHRRRGHVLVEHLGSPLEAVEHYWQIIQAEPHDTELRALLTEIYQRHDLWNDVMLLLENELSIAEEARQQEILLEIGSIWELRLQNSYEALEAYQRVLRRWPDEPRALQALDRLRQGHERPPLGDEALEALGLLDPSEVPSFDESLEITDQGFDEDARELSDRSGEVCQVFASVLFSDNPPVHSDGDALLVPGPADDAFEDESLEIVEEEILEDVFDDVSPLEDLAHTLAPPPPVSGPRPPPRAYSASLETVASDHDDELSDSEVVLPDVHHGPAETLPLHKLAGSKKG